ncbi:CHAT domain-containing protein [Xanthomarina sp. F1114]|uniref:CHAT domain-containing protein n=1 Tax=Xanthomarina sp. F1114 TaxID=2996019 RepID=UPI00225DF906|nr:CHAT domain-containing tetratricopeptide repeat protein [Xanthomarina sp. F1114]MCX7548730.1 CHAT domain-containing protein [Xanthomarina sp. F1114]
MKNKILTLLCLVFAVTNVAIAQNTFNDYYNHYIEGYDTKDLAKMKKGSEDLMTHFSDEFAGFYLHAYYQILNNDLNAAQSANQQAINIQPLLEYAYYTQAYIDFLKGNTDSALQNLEWAAQLSTFPTSDDIVNDMSLIEQISGKDLTTLKTKWTSFYENKKIDNQKALALGQCVNGVFTQGKTCDNLDQLFAHYINLPNSNPVFQTILPSLKAVSLYYKGNSKASVEQFEKFKKLSENNTKLYWRRSHALHFLSVIKNNSFNSRGALLDINEALNAYKNLDYPSIHQASMTFHKINVLNALEAQDEEIIQTAYQLEGIANQINNDYFKAKAYGTIGTRNFFSLDPEEKAKAHSYVMKAYTIANQLNDQALIQSTKNNYAIIKAEQGFYTEASELIEEVAQDYLSKKEYQKAQHAYNNLGAIFYKKEDYINSNKQFEKSIALIENVKEPLNAKQKLEYMNRVSDTYEFLIMGLKQTNEIGKLFKIQEENRGNYLRDLLDKSIPTASLNDAQNMLKDDELLLTYSIGKPGEIIISAITKNNAEIRYNYPLDDLIKLKKTYTDRIKKVPPSLNKYMQDYNVDYVNGKLVRLGNKEKNFSKDDFITLVEWSRDVLDNSDKPDYQNVLNDFMHFWYNLTLLPVQDLTSQYKNVIISAASELNYLPFEAFINPKNNYFITTNNVRYIPNVSVWKYISNRNYAADRKSVIAFGGAQYQPSGNVTATVRNMEDFYKISDAVSKKIDQGIYNFKPELEAIGFGGANYLGGTLEEVQYIGTLANDAKIVTGMDMTESDFKNRNSSGELAEYKNLIISTHGFTGDVIPEFSGLMFSQPDNGDGNEDTFLLAPEIAKLNLNADLVIMSACDTGVGKLYEGEGINGLNTSFLVAGSNSTLLSLWPVDDSGTALTMQLLFTNIIQNNLEANMVLNEIKRAFIKGEFGERGKSPKLWAPFIYNGR